MGPYEEIVLSVFFQAIWLIHNFYRACMVLRYILSQKNKKFQQTGSGGGSVNAWSHWYTDVTKVFFRMFLFEIFCPKKNGSLLQMDSLQPERPTYTVCARFGIDTSMSFWVIERKLPNCTKKTHVLRGPDGARIAPNIKLDLHFTTYKKIHQSVQVIMQKPNGGRRVCECLATLIYRCYKSFFRFFFV